MSQRTVGEDARLAHWKAVLPNHPAVPEPISACRGMGTALYIIPRGEGFVNTKI